MSKKILKLTIMVAALLVLCASVAYAASYSFDLKPKAGTTASFVVPSVAKGATVKCSLTIATTGRMKVSAYDKNGSLLTSGVVISPGGSATLGKTAVAGNVTIKISQYDNSNVFWVTGTISH